MDKKEVSYKLGFNDYSYFSKVFKKYTQLNPSEFLEQLIS